MEKLCKNCKYFKKNEKYDHIGDCECSKIVYYDAIRRLDLPEVYIKLDCFDFQYDEVEKEFTNKCIDYQKDKLMYIDGEDYNVDCNVGINFGCIHWKQKDMG